METVNSFGKRAPSQLLDWVLNTPVASLGCVRYTWLYQGRRITFESGGATTEVTKVVF